MINYQYSEYDLSSIHALVPTEEAVDDAKEAAHGADDRRDHLVTPFNLLITAEQTVWTPILRGWGELKGQNLGSRCHVDSVLCVSTGDEDRG